MTIADLVGKVRQYDPSLEEGWLERVYEVADRAHDGQHRASGESYIAHPLAVADVLADLEMDSAHHRRRAAARRGRRHGHLQRAGRRGVRRRDRGARRRRHQADAHPVPVQRGRAGGEPAQDVPGDGQGHPRHHHQAGRPPAQHAHAVEPAGAQAAVDRARDDRDLRADRAPARHLAREMGSRRPRAALSRARLVPRHRRARREEARRARRSRRVGDHRPQVGVRKSRRASRHHRPPQALLLDPQEDAQRPRLLDDLRSYRGARHRRIGQGLLRRAGRGARDVEAAARAVQRLHRDAQAEHVPVAAHHGRRAGRRSARSADSHVGDAPHVGVRHRGALAVQRRPARRTRSSPGCARCSSGRTTCATRARSWRASRSTSSTRRCSSSRPRATCSRCRRPRRRWTSRIRCTPTSATTAWARRSTARSCRWTRTSRTATSSRS